MPSASGLKKCHQVEPPAVIVVLVPRYFRDVIAADHRAEPVLGVDVADDLEGALVRGPMRHRDGGGDGGP